MGDLRKTQKRAKLSLVELLKKVQSSVVARSQSEGLFDQLLEKYFQVALKKRGFEEHFFSKEQIADYFQYAQYYSQRRVPHLAVRYFLVYCHGCWLHPSITQESFSLLVSIFSLGVNLRQRSECLRVHQEIMKVISLMSSPEEQAAVLIPFFLQKWRVILKKGELWDELKEVRQMLLALNPGHEDLMKEDLRVIQVESLSTEKGLVVYPFPGLRKNLEGTQPEYSKSIFDSGLEEQVYHILVKRLPEYLVLPNHPVANLFIYEEMRELLSFETFHYFHKSRVDYCIISKASFKPVMGIELDGPDHELPRIQLKDELKTEIFKIGGVPLIRFECTQERDPEWIAKAVLEKVSQKILA